MRKNLNIFFSYHFVIFLTNWLWIFFSSLESSVGKHGQQTVSEKQHKKNSISKERTRDKSHRSFPNVTSVDGICPSIDIRNNVSYFQILKDCQVIEGFLQIVLIERFNETDFQNYEFTKLREITGYLLLYRVNGLKSLNKLFPNLEVIRGDTLLTDYAFMIYEMQNLQEVSSLFVILKKILIRNAFQLKKKKEKVTLKNSPMFSSRNFFIFPRDFPLKSKLSEMSIKVKWK